jgi:putative phosphoesterase
MKIVIVADVHGNYDALCNLPEDYDELWVLGDLVNYGPEPGKVIDEIAAKASIAVRGNHDHSVIFTDGQPWKEPYQLIAETTKKYTASILSDQQKEFLRNLPLQVTIERGGTSFYLTHATISDPLSGYLPPDSEEWEQEVERVSADVLLVGHTHVPLTRSIGNKTLVNPGSLGQPRHSSSRAAYAVWQDGVFSLKSFFYPLQETIRKIQHLSFPSCVEKQLISLLQNDSA